MPTLPSEQDLYDEMQATVEGDGATNLVDYSSGSVLDQFTGTIATVARAIERWSLRLTGRAFVSSSTGADLDFVINDRIDLDRQPGESDEDYQARYYDYIAALSRGVESAWRYFLENEVEGVDPATYTLAEDFPSGTLTLTIQPLTGYTEAEIKANAEAEIDAWRIFAGPFPNVETIP